MPRKLTVLLGLALAVLIADQWSKFAIVGALTTRFDAAASTGHRLALLYSKDGAPRGYDGLHFRPRRSITVSEDFFRLRYAENPGAAWGLFRSLPEHLRLPLFHLVTVLAVVIISTSFLKLRGVREEKWAYWGLPLVLGGAVGNWIDRVARGFVVDFLEAHWMDRAHWPSFNVADMAIVVGVGMLLVDALVRKEPRASAVTSA